MPLRPTCNSCLVQMDRWLGLCEDCHAKFAPAILAERRAIIPAAMAEKVPGKVMDELVQAGLKPYDWLDVGHLDPDKRGFTMKGTGQRGLEKTRAAMALFTWLWNRSEGTAMALREDPGAWVPPYSWGSVHGLLEALKEFKTSERQDALDSIAGDPFMVLTGVGDEYPTEWGETALVDLLTSRLENQAWTVFTTTHHPAALLRRYKHHPTRIADILSVRHEWVSKAP